MKFVDWIIVVLLLAIAFGGGTLAVQSPTLVAVVYESNDTTLPPYVIGAVREITEQGIEARIIDDDVISGSGDIPPSILAVIEAARQHGLPALVVNGRAQNIPNSRAALLEAVR